MVNDTFVKWFRDSAPYINAHQGKTMVMALEGPIMQDENFPILIHDIALVSSLGVRVVLVFDVITRVRSQLGREFPRSGLEVIDEEFLEKIKEMTGKARVELEALLSKGLVSAQGQANIKVSSGNFIMAKPFGIHEGVDYLQLGEVRNINVSAINNQLNYGSLVIMSPIGYSLSGETFAIPLDKFSRALSSQLAAEKLVYFYDSTGLETPVSDAFNMLEAQKYSKQFPLLGTAVACCQAGVKRVHLIDFSIINGGLLQELFTRDGGGIMVYSGPYEDIREANIEDITGIIDLIAPLEEEGILVKRSREHLEMEIENFTVMERDGKIIGCAALFPHQEEQMAELACLAVHHDYISTGRGQALLEHSEKLSKQIGLDRLFVLTTRTLHWFLERGFSQSSIDNLPIAKQQLYNYSRKSQVLVKTIS